MKTELKTLLKFNKMVHVVVFCGILGAIAGGLIGIIEGQSGLSLVSLIILFICFLILIYIKKENRENRGPETKN